MKTLLRLVFALFLTAPLAGAAELGKKQNVILFILDDWGRDAGCFGNKIIRTPNIDALAADGTVFTHAFCTTASCSPSRSVILTGLHNHANGQYSLAHSVHAGRTFASVKSLPVLLAAGGWRTARIGKFHVAPEEVYHFETELKGNQGGGRNAVTMAERCREFLAAPDARPFFLYFCTDDPHRSGDTVAGDPLGANAFGNGQRHDGVDEVKYDPQEVSVPAFLPDTPECRAELAQYYQAVSRVDQGLGRLVGILRETGHLDDTLIVLTSDNGIPFPGAKTGLYEDGMHLPLIVRAPGQRRRGGKCDAMISWVDFTPTILDFCGVKTPDSAPLRALDDHGAPAPGAKPQPYKFHGRSWAGLWEKENAPGWDEVFASHAAHEITMYYPMRVLRERRYKLLYNIAYQLPYPFASDLWESATWQRTQRGGDSHYGQRLTADFLQRPKYELYDLETDPGEIHNLAADPAHAEELARMSAKVKAFQERTGDPWVVKYVHE